MEKGELAMGSAAERVECPYVGCSNLNPPDAKFCGRCGRSLLATSYKTATTMPTPTSSGLNWFAQLGALLVGLCVVAMISSRAHGAAVGVVGLVAFVALAASRRRAYRHGRRRALRPPRR